MQRFLLGFCGGALMLGLPWPGGSTLPGWLAAAAGAGLMVLVPGWRWRALRPWAPVIAGVLLGLVWSGLAHDRALSARLPVDAGDAGALTVRVVSEPVTLAGPPEQPPSLRFQARIIASATHQAMAGRVVRLSWYGAPGVRRGDRWRLHASLKGPWSYANPAGFDYERWLLGAGIQGTGYVRAGTLQQRTPAVPLDRLRQRLGGAVAALELSRGGILRALLVGRADGIGEAHWEVFRATGTVHLMVISGLHVSLAAGLGMLLGRWGGRLVPGAPLWLDARRAGCLGGVVTAAGYVAVAGAGLPAVRALVMAVSVLGLLAWGRTSGMGGGLLLALAALLAVDPLAVHQQGLWLSFGAVLVLLITLGGQYGRGGGLRGLLRAQVALSLAMLPLVVLATASLPWTGILGNLVAVPAMSLAVVPMTLAGGVAVLVWPAAGALLLGLADAVLGGVLGWLGLLARAPGLAAVGGTGALVVAQAAALWWLFDVPGRHLAVLALCWLLPLAPRGPEVKAGTYRVAALDVGQGSAVVVDTRRHRLVFDAGPGFPSGFETGSAVVVPNLRADGRPRVDVLVLSHADLDHVGGASYLLAHLPVARVLSSAREWGEPCDGRDWRWDGVQFRLLALSRPPGAADNDLSCVLLVDDGRRRALLAGDLSAALEGQLLRAVGRPVDLMFAPHHGSLTSSSRALVRVMAPGVVFVSAGRGNRFGHPHPDVVERYRHLGARLYQTGREGSLTWDSAAAQRVGRWRRDEAPYWRSRDSGAAPDTSSR